MNDGERETKCTKKAKEMSPERRDLELSCPCTTTWNTFRERRLCYYRDCRESNLARISFLHSKHGICSDSPRTPYGGKANFWYITQQYTAYTNGRVNIGVKKAKPPKREVPIDGTHRSRPYVRARFLLADSTTRD